MAQLQRIRKFEKKPKGPPLCDWLRKVGASEQDHNRWAGLCGRRRSYNNPIVFADQKVALAGLQILEPVQVPYNKSGP